MLFAMLRKDKGNLLCNYSCSSYINLITDAIQASLKFKT
jgi:hypothetical protein